MKLKLLAVIAVLISLCSCAYDNLNDSKTTEQANSRVPAAIPYGLKVHFIDVGHGDSILVQTPNGKSMLIDAGKKDEGQKVTDYIKSQGITKLDVLVGTHPHEDHIGGMEQVLKNFDTSKIYMPKKSTTTKTFEDFLKAIKEKGLKVDTAFAGVNIDMDPAVKIQMLAPNSNNYDDLNNYSAVIKMTYKRTAFLLTGDAQSISEKEMLSRGYDLKSDVLKVGHHGSSSSTTSKFLEAVSPDTAVISEAKSNDYNLPAKETLKKLSDAGIRMLMTGEEGTITAESDGNNISFNP